LFGGASPDQFRSCVLLRNLLSVLDGFVGAPTHEHYSDGENTQKRFTGHAFSPYWKHAHENKVFV
jgi:hypothetical protein